LVLGAKTLASDGEESDGIYLNVTDENSAEFFFGDQGWEFEKGIISSSIFLITHP
jgi:hypothetical protein